MGALCLAAVTAFAVCGCGGVTRLSEVEFQARANAACTDANGEIRALPVGKGGTFASVAEESAELAPITQRLALKLRVLTPPASYQPRWTVLTAELTATPKLLSKMRSAALAADGPELQALSDQINGMDMSSIALGLGLPECGRDVQPGAS